MRGRGMRGHANPNPRVGAPGTVHRPLGGQVPSRENAPKPGEAQQRSDGKAAGTRPKGKAKAGPEVFAIGEPGPSKFPGAMTEKVVAEPQERAGSHAPALGSAKVQVTKDATTQTEAPVSTSKSVQVPSEVPESPRGGDRVRRRGAATNAASNILERSLEELVDSTIAGGKTSRSVVTILRTLFGAELKVHALRGVSRADDGAEQGSDNAEPVGNRGFKYPTIDVWAMVSVEPEADTLLVSLDLVCRMVNYMAFRPRDVSTPRLLAVKARQYAKEIGLTAVQLSMVIHGSVALAMLVPRREYAAINSLGGRSGALMVRWSERLRSGLLRGEGYVTMTLRKVAQHVRWIPVVLAAGAGLWLAAPTLWAYAQTMAWVWWHIQLAEALSVVGQVWHLVQPYLLGPLLLIGFFVASSLVMRLASTRPALSLPPV